MVKPDIGALKVLPLGCCHHQILLLALQKLLQVED